MAIPVWEDTPEGHHEERPKALQNEGHLGSYIPRGGVHSNSG